MRTWTTGMSGGAVSVARRDLARRFAYARHLPDSLLLDADCLPVLAEYQRRKGIPVTNALDPETVAALGLWPQITVPPGAPPPQPGQIGTLYTVCGTGVGMWDGPPADTARAVADLWYHQPVAYPAALPFEPSIRRGVDELVRLMQQSGGPAVLCGYSQGAWVISRAWQREILPPGGRLHHRLRDIAGAVTWGNPCREAGVAHGNSWSGQPVPPGRGASGELLVDTPVWWLDFAHPADIYTSTSPNEHSAEHMEAFSRLVQGPATWVGPNSLPEQIGEIFVDPGRELPAAIDAGVRAALFAFQGTKPHLSYDISPAISYLRSFR